MTITQFAQTVKQKYPQYQDIPDEQLGNQMLEKYPQYKSQVVQATPTDPTTFGSALPGGSQAKQETGKPAGKSIYDIPVLGGILRGAIEPSQQMAKQAQGEQGLFSGPVFGINTPAGTKTYANAAAKNGIGGVIQAAGQVLPAQVGTAATAIGIKDLPGILSSIASIPKYITKGTTNKAIEQAASKGTDINWNELADTARKEVANKSQPVKDALERLITEQSPSTTAGYVNPAGLPGTANAAETLQPSASNITSSQALDIRRELGSRLPGNFFEKALSKVTPAEQDAINILRRTVSGMLKQNAPDIVTPDKVYSFYSKIHGDAPTWAKRIITAEAIKHIGGKVPGIGPLLNEIPVP